MIHKTGDLFANVKTGMIAHGCNTQGVMGSGVAKIVRDLYPKAYDKYREKFINEGLLLGTIVPAQVLGGQFPLYIVNCITQKDYGRDPDTQYVSYDAVDQAFETLAKYVSIVRQPLHFPLIGGGLGNGDRDALIAIFEKHFPGDEATLWELSPYVV